LRAQYFREIPTIHSISKERNRHDEPEEEIGKCNKKMPMEDSTDTITLGEVASEEEIVERKHVYPNCKRKSQKKKKNTGFVIYMKKKRTSAVFLLPFSFSCNYFLSYLPIS
jgi:hypothetical protein